MNKIALCLLLVASPMAVAADAYEIQLDLYRVTASISGNTSLTEDIGVRGPYGKLNALVGGFTFFTLADLRIGTMHFEFAEDGGLWDGKPRPGNPSEVVVLASPRIRTAPRQSAELQLRSRERYQYMVKTNENQFELKETELDTGLKWSCRVAPQADPVVRLEEFTISLAALEGREPIPGVDLPIGKPVVRTDTDTTTMNLTLGRSYGIQWSSRSHGMLLILFRVSRPGP